MATRTDCPVERHGRSYDDQSKRLTCGMRDCRCAECHKPLTEAERKEWIGPP